MTLKNLAQFHAVGYAMTDDIGYEAMLQKHKELKEVAYLPDSSLLHSMFDNMTGSAVSILNVRKLYLNILPVLKILLASFVIFIVIYKLGEKITLVQNSLIYFYK